MEPTRFRMVLDTNAVANPDPKTAADLAELDALFRDGKVVLTRTDTMDTEFRDASEDKRASLLAESSKYVEHMGPAVYGQSRWGASVWASPDDATRIDAVYAILKPGGDRSNPNQNDLRDAMHIATAVRYGATHFVTSDGSILRRREALRDAFDWFTVMTPAEAVELVHRFIAKDEELRRRSE